MNRIPLSKTKSGATNLEVATEWQQEKVAATRFLSGDIRYLSRASGSRGSRIRNHLIYYISIGNLHFYSITYPPPKRLPLATRATQSLSTDRFKQRSEAAKE